MTEICCFIIKVVPSLLILPPLSNNNPNNPTSPSSLDSTSTAPPADPESNLTPAEEAQEEKRDPSNSSTLSEHSEHSEHSENSGDSNPSELTHNSAQSAQSVKSDPIDHNEKVPLEMAGKPDGKMAGKVICDTLNIFTHALIRAAARDIHLVANASRKAIQTILQASQKNRYISASQNNNVGVGSENENGGYRMYPQTIISALLSWYEVTHISHISPHGTTRYLLTYIHSPTLSLSLSRCT